MNNSCRTQRIGTKTPFEVSAGVEKITSFLQGTFFESFDALVTSDGATITMSLEQAGGGDLTMHFSDGDKVLVTTPADTIPLTAGTDADPQKNYIYIPQSTKVLTKSTTGFPVAEHIKVGFFFVQSAGTVQTNGTLINQNWNDHTKETSGAGAEMGHLAHLTDRERLDGARWFSGCEGVATQDGNDLWVSVAAGIVYQAHPHTFAALDSDTAGAGDLIQVVNDPDAAYAVINSLNEITKHTGAGGTDIGNNRYVKFVLFGVANKTGDVEHMLLKLPSGQYNTAEGAERDVDGHADFSIPREFLLDSSTGFLIASFVCKHTSTAMEIDTTTDQRGKAASTATNAGTGGGDVSAAAVLADNSIIRGDGGAKGVQDSGVLIDDSDNITAATSVTADVLVANGNLVGNNAGGDFDSQIKGENDDDTFYVDAGADSVGIGTAAPSQKLHIIGNVIIGTDGKLHLRDTGIFIHSNADGELTIEADSKVIIGVAGDIELGDGTLRLMKPNTDEKIDLGSPGLRLRRGYFSEGVSVGNNTTDFSDPPTDAELNAAIGTPAALGPGFIAIIDDNSGDTDTRICYTTDGSWYYLPKGTKAV